MQLAHEALMSAQSADPDHVEAWVGQAMVAESIASPEAMDLFRHSSQLGYNVSMTIIVWPVILAANNCHRLENSM